ncbi:tyrosine-protein phosphatase [Lactiplantibacillus nangangensis]|uniref:Tyrosine-protein phosphatase n=1 Tax=Lactiplantibacillus nangangensis TaxID=2559917 RepID=A0ABW1SKY3_9LACO|nr:CpsB/CapC family capsule biosynthesis tyrosine phosphatase [Lactiplantibacillus nangangensis]
MMETNQLVDLHCHILPSVDDGPQSLEAAIELAIEAVADGVGYILATPHHLDRHYTNHAVTVRQAVKAFQTELTRRQIQLTLFPSQEIHVTGQLMARLDDVLGMDAEGKFLLLELPHEMVPNYVNEIVFQLLCRGITPIIAHPERNDQILASPQILFDLVRQGALAQVTATSLVGGFGRRVQRLAKQLVVGGLAQVVGSDAHASKDRAFAMTRAYQVLAAIEPGLPEQFKSNAKNLLNGEEIRVTATKVSKGSYFSWFYKGV